MDCSSPYVMAGVVAQKDRFDLVLAADPDADRHGVVTPGAGLLPPNHYLCVAVEHLLAHRPTWSTRGAIGRSVVTSALIDRISARHGRALVEVPVGFKWFVAGLASGAICFGGEESAGASLLCRDGNTWTTDKDGIALGLLAAEIRARDEIDLGARYRRIEEELGEASFRRVDRPTSPDEKKLLLAIDAAQITEQRLGGELILTRATAAAGNGESIGGIRLGTASAWFAMRPSGTEALCKVYAESFRGAAHLERVLEEGQALVSRAIATRGNQSASP
jgi:phosphoglucomutase